MYIYIHTSSDLYKAPHMPASLPPSCPPPLIQLSVSIKPAFHNIIFKSNSVLLQMPF